MYEEKSLFFLGQKQQKEWRKHMIDANETGRYKNVQTQMCQKLKISQSTNISMWTYLYR